jgi:hypothetical protein
MAVGRILVNGSDEGSGFTLNGAVAITAGHVVRDQKAESLQFMHESRNVAVDKLEADEELDVAVLHLKENLIVGPFLIGRPVEKAAWEITGQPRANDPKLTGIISGVNLPFQNAQEHETRVLQLLVEQILGNYQGYSGSPVVLSAPLSGTIGILVEQQHWRLRPIGHVVPAANVLYAIPIESVLLRFGLTWTLAMGNVGSALPKFSEFKSKMLQQRLTALLADYEAVSTELDIESSEVARNRLRRRATLIEQEIVRIENELAALSGT